jgi:putative hydrolase of the HAD superfamily
VAAGLILFDLDDTLISEMDFVKSGFAAVAATVADRREISPETVTARLWAAFRVNPRQVIDRVGQELTLSPSEVDELVRVYRYHQPDLALLDDAKHGLDWAVGLGVQVGLLTDGDPRTQRLKMAAVGLDQCLDPVVLTGELPPGCGKPNPAGYDRALREANVAPGDSVYIADNAAKDFVGATVVGMHSIQIVRPGGLYADVHAPDGGEPELVISTLFELGEAARQLGLSA